MTYEEVSVEVVNIQCGGSASVERVFAVEFGQNLHCKRETNFSRLKAEENTHIQVNDCDERKHYV